MIIIEKRLFYSHRMGFHMAIKGVNPKFPQTTYGSPENSQHPYTQTPDYSTPEANTPDPNVSSLTYGNIPPGEVKPPVQDTSAQDRLTQLAGVAVGDKFTQAPVNEQATYGMPIPSSSQAAAGTSTNPPTGQYPPNPTPMQGPGDNQNTGAVMPKLQVTGDPQQVYGINHIHNEECAPTCGMKEEGGPGSGRRPQGRPLNRIGQTPGAGDSYRQPQQPQRIVGERVIDMGGGSTIRVPIRRDFEITAKRWATAHGGHFRTGGSSRRRSSGSRRSSGGRRRTKKELEFDALLLLGKALSKGGPGSGRHPHNGDDVGEAHRNLTSQGYRVTESTSNADNQQNYRMYQGPSDRIYLGHMGGRVNHVSVGKAVSKPGVSHTVVGSQWENQDEIGLGNVTRPQEEGKDKVTPTEKATHEHYSGEFVTTALGRGKIVAKERSPWLTAGDPHRYKVEYTPTKSRWHTDYDFHTKGFNLVLVPGVGIKPADKLTPEDHAKFKAKGEKCSECGAINGGHFKGCKLQ
jgi:hypothetical protein